MDVIYTTLLSHIHSPATWSASWAKMSPETYLLPFEDNFVENIFQIAALLQPNCSHLHKHSLFLQTSSCAGAILITFELTKMLTTLRTSGVISKHSVCELQCLAVHVPICLQPRGNECQCMCVNVWRREGSDQAYLNNYFPDLTWYSQMEKKPIT